MFPSISEKDEQILIELRYGVADLVALMQQVSADFKEDVLGITSLLEAIDVQAGLALHLREVQAASRGSASLLCA